MKKISIVLLLCFLTIKMYSQENNILIEKDLKYYKHYFLAEKHKVLDEYEDALREYENCITQNPKESAALFEAAKIYFKQGDYKQAEAHMLSARKIYPENIWYTYFLMDIYSQNFDLKKQAGLLHELIKSDSKNLIYYLELITIYIDLEDYTKGLKELYRAEKKYKNNEALILLESEIFAKKNNTDKAISILLLAHQKFPKSIIFLDALSEYYIQQSEYVLANEMYKKILEIEPYNPTALLASYKILQSQNLVDQEKKAFLRIFNSPRVSPEQKREVLFEIFSQTKKIEMYKEILPQALENSILIHPTETMFYILLGDYQLLHNEHEKALNNYVKATMYGTKEKILYEKILNISLVNNKLDDVIFYAQEAIEYFPFGPIFYYYKGVALLYKKEYEKVKNSITKGLNYVIDDPQLESEMYAILGDVYHSLENHVKSDESYEIALKNNPDYIIVLNNYSYYLSLRGGGDNLLKAEKMILRCLDLTKNNPEPSFLDTYAWVLFQQGKEEKNLIYKKEKYVQSEKIMKQCIEQGGNSAEIYEHYGDVLFELENIKSAITNWIKALEINTHNVKLKKKIKMGQKKL